MSTDVTAAAINKLQRFAQEWRAVFALVDDLKDFVSLEHERDKLHEQLDTMRVDAASVANEINNSRAQLDKAHDELVGVEAEIERDRAHCADMVQAAKASAEDIVTKAHAAAEGIKRDALAHVEGTRGTIEALQQELVLLEAQRTDVQTNLSLLKRDHKALMDKHSKVLDGLKALGIN